MIVVTGGAGFVGSHLVRLLVDRGDAVRVVERPDVDVAHLALDASPQLQVVRADIRDRGAVRAALAGSCEVYHLAANPNLWTRHRADFDAVNHRGAVHVLEEALSAGARRVLHVSTESILTARSSPTDAIETVELDERRLAGPYTLSKLRAEQAAFHLARAGAPVLIANPTLPVGPGDRGLSPPSRMTRLFCSGKMPMYLECRFNMIDVRDVALGLIRTMERGRSGRRYILGAHNIRLSEWLALLAPHCGRRVPRFRIPYPMALLYAFANEFAADWITGRIPDATVTGVRLTRHKMHFEAAATLAELGIVPRSLADSARAAARWSLGQTDNS